MTEATEEGKEWDTSPTIPAPGPSPSRRNREGCRAQLLLDLERTEARASYLRMEIARIEVRLEESGG